MENKIVTFNKGKSDGEKNIPDSFTITVEGNLDDYRATISTLLWCVSAMPEDLIRNDERSNICRLIDAMIPTEEQIKIIANAQGTGSVKWK